VEGKVKFLSSLVGDANLSGKIEAARTDIFSKYPDANKAHSDTYLLYMFCTFVLSDQRLSPQEKFDAIQNFRKPLSSEAKAQTKITTYGANSPLISGTQGA
jgi:hypothetical protein